MEVCELKRLKQLEDENRKLKQLVPIRPSIYRVSSTSS